MWAARDKQSGFVPGGGTITHSPPWSPSSGVRPSFAVLLLLSAAWLLALLSVNSDTLLFHYLFAACNCIQVVASPDRWEAQGDGVWG